MSSQKAALGHDIGKNDHHYIGKNGKQLKCPARGKWLDYRTSIYTAERDMAIERENVFTVMERQAEHTKKL